MKNKVAFIRIFLFLLGMGLLAVLTGCEGLATLMENLDDEVKLANDRYLEVTGTYPEQNDNNLSPRIDILINLDRDIDVDAIRDYILIEQRDLAGDISVFGDGSGETVEMEFNPVDKTLTITPDPFVNGGEKIIVTVLPGARALDGSVVRDPVSWSFYTMKMPVGVVRIEEDADPYALPGYTNDSNPDLNLEWSFSDEYLLTESESVRDTALEGGGGPWVGGISSSGTLDLITGPETWSVSGEKTIWVVYQNSTSGAISLAESDSIYFDGDPPTGLDAGLSIGSGTDSSTNGDFINTVFSRSVSASDGESGVHKYIWSSPNGGVALDPDSATTEIRGPAGQWRDNVQMTVTAYDMAGNAAVDSFTFDWDDEPPGRPTITTVSDTSTGDPNLEWSWTAAAPLHGDSSNGFERRYGMAASGDKTSWRSWISDGDTSHTQTVENYTSLNVGIYNIYLSVREYDSLDNVSSADTSDVITYFSVSPSYGRTLIHSSLPSSISVDFPGSTGTYGLRYREEGETLWNIGSVDRLGASRGTISTSSIGYGTYEWQYAYVFGKGTYYSPIFKFNLYRFIVVL